MQCPNCNNPITENDVFCPSCRTYIGCNNVPQEYYQQPQQTNILNKETDKINLICCLISFLNPCVGIALYYVWRNQFPKKAKSCLISGIISFLLIAGLMFFYFSALLITLVGSKNLYNDIYTSKLTKTFAYYAFNIFNTV